jgi:hypothetical protein
MKLFEFMREYGDTLTIVAKLRAERLLARQFICESCTEPMHDLATNSCDGLIFSCDKRACRRRKSIRTGSFFENSKLSLSDTMLFLHLWSKGYSEKLILDDFLFCKSTVVDWSRFCRDLCVFHFELDDVVIGGPGCIVEIDETMAVKRKYNRGRVLRAGWLFGGVERRGDGQFKCFLRMVYDRSGDHLTYWIRQHVARGTHIITDGWPAYAHLSTMGYTHSVVIHEDNFVSPEDDAVHTQTIEATWCSLKRFIWAHGTNKGPHYLEYICEYMFRRKFPNLFEAVLCTIRQKYPLL